MDRKDFLLNRLVPLLRQIPYDRPPQWGKMTVQQMVEHFSDAVRIASGKAGITSLLVPDNELQKLQAFMRSDKPFRENILNPLMPEVPAPVKNPSLDAALNELQSEIVHFFKAFEQDHLGTSRNPFFGDLDFQDNLQILTKHAQHHLRQFGVHTTNENQS